MQLKAHVVDATDPKNLQIQVVDQKGPGGDNHRYAITGFDITSNPSYSDREFVEDLKELNVYFQYGNPAEGVNGITMEALLAICEHRLQGLETGPYPCIENDEALHHVGKAIEALHRR